MTVKKEEYDSVMSAFGSFDANNYSGNDMKVWKSRNQANANLILKCVLEIFSFMI